MYIKHSVIKAFLDSYLSMRAKVWGQKEFDPTALSQGSPGHKKTELVKELLIKMPDSYATQDWLEFVYLLAEKGHAEATVKEAHRKGPSLFDTLHTHLNRIAVGPESMAERTMRAIRSYIIDQLADGNRLGDIAFEKDTLLTNINRLESELDITRKTPAADPARIETLQNQLNENKRKHEAIVSAEGNKYHEKFYNEVIKVRDPRDGEVTFDDFMKNATTGKRRNFENCAKLMQNVPLATRKSKGKSPLAVSTTFGPIDTPDLPPLLPPRTRRKGA